MKTIITWNMFDVFVSRNRTEDKQHDNVVGDPDVLNMAGLFDEITPAIRMLLSNVGFTWNDKSFQFDDSIDDILNRMYDVINLAAAAFENNMSSDCSQRVLDSFFCKLLPYTRENDDEQFDAHNARFNETMWIMLGLSGEDDLDFNGSYVDLFIHYMRKYLPTI